MYAVVLLPLVRESWTPAVSRMTERVFLVCAQVVTRDVVCARQLATVRRPSYGQHTASFAFVCRCDLVLEYRMALGCRASPFCMLTAMPDARH